MTSKSVATTAAIGIARSTANSPKRSVAAATETSTPWNPPPAQSLDARPHGCGDREGQKEQREKNLQLPERQCAHDDRKDDHGRDERSVSCLVHKPGVPGVGPEGNVRGGAKPPG